MLTLHPTRPMRLADAMSRLLDDSFVRPYGRPSEVEAYALPVDVVATDEAFVITASVPGLRPEDLHVEVLGNAVTLHGEVFAPEGAEQANWLLQERRFGKFGRTLNFPVDLDSTQAEAAIENGVLTLRVPKAEAARPKQIKVKAK
jgi:HSP20 family protein